MPCRAPSSRLSVFAIALLAGITGCARENPETAGERQERTDLLRIQSLPVTREEPRQFHAIEDGGTTSVSWRPEGGEETSADRQIARLSPDADGWESERLSEAANAQLKRLVAAATAAELEQQLAPGFASNLQLSQPLEPVFDDGFVAVAATSGVVPEAVAAGAADLRSGLQMLGGHVGPAPEYRIKTIAVDLPDDLPDTFKTTVLVEVSGAVAGAPRQLNVTWTCLWGKPGPDDAAPLLRRLAGGRQIVVSAPHALFAEATAAALAGTPHFPLLIARGIDYWAERLSRIDDMHLSGHHGLAVGDVDGDGLEDLYACDGGGLPNQLYLQNADGSLRDVSRAAGVDWLEDSRSALLVDLDNDGDQDLVVATVALILFAENDGAGRFSLRGGFPGISSPHSMAASDLENDGDLDIYICSYGAGGDAGTGAREFEAHSPVPFHDANNGGRNVLLENLGGFAFVDATTRLGLDANNMRWSFSAAWEDFDGDGDADLYVANDFGRNNLYRNDGGPAPGARFFTDIAAEAGVEDQAAGMSATWGDYNRDGTMDLYVGNMFSAAGRRVTYQRKFTGARAARDTAGMQRMARGNTLFAQRPDGSFEDVSETAGVTMGRWAWSSGFADIDNDGWEDIVIANGNLTNQHADDL